MSATIDSRPADARAQLLSSVASVVRAILIRKSGMSLATDDARPDNVEALELHQDVLARLWERLADASDAAPSPTDFKAYAATVTYNAWSDHLRAKYPQRASLKNRLRYFLGHQPRYALWDNADRELVCGPKRWQLGDRSAVPTRIAALRDGRDRLPSSSVPRGAMERCTAADWARLVDAIFDHVGGPVVLDDLVAIVAVTIGLKEHRVVSIDHVGENDDGDARDEASDPPDTESRSPEDTVALVETLRKLWAAIQGLKPDYRAAYLLNIPGPGKSRGDIEVFPVYGVASVVDIGRTLALSADQYDLARQELGFVTPGAATSEFDALWEHLPLSDALIGRLLGLEQQQVINRRMLALRELARALGGRRGER